MKLTFKKEFDGDMEKLPQRQVEGAVIFKEPKTLTGLSILANGIGAVLIIAALVPIVLIKGGAGELLTDIKSGLQLLLAAFLMLVSMPVHELLHAVCFKEEVEFYTALKKGLLFVVGTESMSKGRFVLMSMLPNLVFGFLPYLLFFLFPSQLWLGFFGAVSIGAGAGDYINVFNALTQMPKGALCFMSKNRSYWYIP